MKIIVDALNKIRKIGYPINFTEEKKSSQKKHSKWKEKQC